jgi:predicted AAA+ superfamily ATPase
MEKIVALYRFLLSKTSTNFVRYLYEKIEWKARMFGIVGARGVGKTTMLLQHIKLHLNADKTLYINADDAYFAQNSLFDFADTFHKNGGKHLFIDEIHKYPRWSKDLKMMYDYFPDMQVVFTGSSILDIYRGADDLSRRALQYYMAGLSFREYLNMSKNKQVRQYSMDEILANKVDLPVEHPLPVFREYLRKGCYPFYDDVGFEIRVQNIVNQTIENDIPLFSGMNMATSRKLKQLLFVVAQSVPFKPNFNDLARAVEVHRNQVKEYLILMQKAGLLMLLQGAPAGMKLLEKTEKIFLANPNLIHALAAENSDTGNVRETFFASQVSVNNVITAAERADFMVNGCTFEVGGKSKAQRQIKNTENAFVVKDDIEYGYQNIVPLWAFGLNY